MKKEEWLKKGYVDEPVEKALDLKAEIKRLCREKDAVILGHYYQADEIQEIADFIGDSLALAQWAAKTDAKQKSVDSRLECRMLFGRQLSGR